MSIIVYKNDIQVSSDIKFVNMAPWNAGVKTLEHSIDGANIDVLYHRGRNSPTTTITGYCLRTKANLDILEGLKDGSKLRIVHSLEGTREGYCVSLNPSQRGTFVTFSMTLKAQEIA